MGGDRALTSARYLLVLGLLVDKAIRKYNKRMQRRTRAMEMRCYRTIPPISYKDHVTNGKVFAEIQQAIGPHEDLLTIVKRCKLK